MSEASTTTATAQKRPLGFGAERLAEAVFDRIQSSVDGSASSAEPALVVGVFGEWGCGKSTMLSSLKDRIVERLAREQSNALPASYTVPIWFNAWRFEREEHLIIPLLKCAQIEIKKAFAGGRTPNEAWRSAIDARLGLMTDLIVAASSSLFESASLQTPIGVALKPDSPWKFWKRFKEQRKERAEDAKTEIDRLRSIHYEFQDYLRALTGRNKSGFKAEFERLRSRAIEAAKWKVEESETRLQEALNFKLNLVFLIDDLDRCLPEKAVEVLEAIKLFLEVEGCSFVLALDDEVIERGIAHRYRDYIFRSPAQGDHAQSNSHSALITGAEYLEKIVQLPLRLTRPSRAQVDQFLRQTYPEWCQPPPRRAVPDAASREGNVTPNPKSKDESDRGDQIAADERAAALADSLRDDIVAIVPPVPRKLVRVMELMQIYETVLTRRGIAPDRRALLILSCLQLFAPELFRFLRIRGAFLLGEMASWVENASFGNLEELKANLKQLREASTSHVAQFDLESKEKLPDLIRNVQSNRSGFDLRRLLNVYTQLTPLEGDRDSEMQRYFGLFSDQEVFSLLQPGTGAAKEIEINLTTPVATIEGSGTVGTATDTPHQPEVWLSAAEYASRYRANPFVHEAAVLENPQAFIAALSSNVEKAWMNAISRESPSLTGRVLPNRVFDELLVNWNDALTSPHASDAATLMARLKLLGPHLSADQALRCAPLMDALLNPTEGTAEKVPN